MRKHRRWIILIALLLLNGAIVNVGVAWGLVALQREPRTRPVGWTVHGWVARIDTDSPYFVYVYPAFGYSHAYVRYEPNSSLTDVVHRPSWVRFHVEEATPGSMVSQHEASGLPFRTLRASSPAGISFRDTALPASPLFPGLIINTIFYAIILALPYLGFTALRRAHRNKLGRCPTCAYDLNATPDDKPCPECGRIRPSPGSRVPRPASPRVGRALTDQRRAGRPSHFKK